jgi:sigma-B regulation protein RsbU (phosphoserine phosphatase)
VNRKGISYQLSIYIVSATIIVVGVMVYLNYNFSKHILRQKIEESAVNQSNIVISRVTRYTATAQEISRNVAAQVLYYHKNGDLEMFLANVLKNNPIINTIHVDLSPEYFKNTDLSYHACVEKQGVCCGSVAAGLRQQQFPQSVPEHGVWSGTFYCKCDSTQLLCSYTYPIYLPDSNVLCGIVSAEISVTMLDQIVSGIKIGDRGFSFVTDKDGTYITHPEKSWIKKRNLYKVPKSIYPEDISTLETRLNTKGFVLGASYPEMFNHEKAWFYLARIPTTQWIVAVVIPEKDLYKGLELIQNEIIIVSGFGILLIFVLVVLIFQRTLSPLVKITEAFQKFSFGDVSGERNKNEITALIESLEELQERYGEMLREQTQTRRDRRKMEKDLKSAREIQQTIIPSTFPAFPDRPEIDIYAFLSPAETIGGDLYDYFFVDKNHLLFAIGDVSGKGIPASLFMAVAHTLLKANANTLLAKEIVERINKGLSVRNANQHFLTLFVGVLDIETGVLNYCNAAHNHPYIIRADGSVSVLADTHGLPLGIYKNKPYVGNAVVLRKDDMIFLYTDGVIDACDKNGTHYTVDRLRDNLENLHDLTCREVIMKVAQSVKIFKGEVRQTDDISLMAIKYLKDHVEL